MIKNLISIGDSHVTFLERAGIMRSHWLGPLNCVTIYQLLKQNLELDKLTQLLRDSAHYKNVGVYPWQCPNGVYDVPNVQPGDKVIFSFGFNDVQKNINKYAAANPKDEILKLVHGYVDLLKLYEIKYKISCIPMRLPPNPAPRENKSYGHYLYGIGGEFDAHGTTEERNFYTQYTNATLKKQCEKTGCNF